MTGSAPAVRQNLSELPTALRSALARLPGAVVRPTTDDDAPGLITLVGGAYDEYPGCVLDLPGVDDDLPRPASHAAKRGTSLWVVEHDESIAACIGAGPISDQGTIELKRLYVRSSHRRRGLARGLVGLVESHARHVGATTVELWTDTRFHDAHRLYESLGYADTGTTRDLGDPSQTTERHYLRELAAP